MSEFATLELHREKRPSQEFSDGMRKTEREFLDFVINGKSLWQICEEERFDIVSCLWLPTIYQPNVQRLLLESSPSLSDGRSAIYICPECGSIDCGAVVVRIEIFNDRVVWRDFAFVNSFEEYPLDSFNVFDPVVFELAAYRNMLLPLLQKE
jgi:hypothetical protein